MSGRPPSSFLYPCVWRHLEDTGVAGNHITLKNLNLNFCNRDDFSLPYKSRLSNRLFEQKFRAERMSLVDFKTAADVVYLVNYKRSQAGLALVDEASSVIPFNHRVLGLFDVISQRTSEHGSMTIESIAIGAGVTENTVASVANGRLVPKSIALDICKVAGLGADSIEPCVVGRGNTPVNSEACIRNIASKLAA